MYGTPCKAPRKAPRKAIILRPHWQFQLKHTGDRRSRNCCDGSKCAAPELHAVTSSYSSFVNKGNGGDIKDDFSHDPSPDVPSYMQIDNANSEWWTQRYNKETTLSHVLSVLGCLQGHPKNGKIYERHINQILSSKELNFKATVHDCCIYQITYKGHKIRFLRQVDDFALATHNESIYKDIYSSFGGKLQLPCKTDPPFMYFGLINDYNGVDVNQKIECIEITDINYIDRVVTSHGRNDTVKSLNPDKPLAPMSEDSVSKVFVTTHSIIEGSAAHKNLEERLSSAIAINLVICFFVYVTCCPDI